MGAADLSLFAQVHHKHEKRSEHQVGGSKIAHITKMADKVRCSSQYNNDYAI